MNIFIPVLVICLNGTCEFMQAKIYYKTDQACRVVLDAQKLHMKNLIKESGKDKDSLIEGTCIDAEIKLTRGQTI
jgi:hypothetical protein